MFENVPSLRTTPPSDPTNAMSGAFGWNTIARTSTCAMLRGFCASLENAWKVAPPFVDRIVPSPNCGVEAPPSRTVSGRPGGVATTRS
jgi:hypothetical protein